MSEEDGDQRSARIPRGESPRSPRRHRDQNSGSVRKRSGSGIRGGVHAGLLETRIQQVDPLEEPQSERSKDVSVVLSLFPFDKSVRANVKL